MKKTYVAEEAVVFCSKIGKKKNKQGEKKRKLTQDDDGCFFFNLHHIIVPFIWSALCWL